MSKGSVSKNVFENVTEFPKPRTKTQDVDFYNLNQTLKLMHACDKPLSEDKIEKIIGENPLEELVIDVTIFDSFIDNVLNGKDYESEYSSDEDPIARQENVVRIPPTLIMTFLRMK